MIPSHAPWIGVYLRKIPAITGPLHTLIARCGEQAKTRLARGSETRDLFYFLVSPARPPPASGPPAGRSLLTRGQNHEDAPDRAPPPLAHLVDDAMLAMIAGADTVTSTLTSLFALLRAHPAAYARLEAEVDGVLPPGEDPVKAGSEKEMVWLNACMCVSFSRCTAYSRS